MSREPMSPLGAKLFDFAVNRARAHVATMGVCRVCMRSTSRAELRANGGCCVAHRDEAHTATRQGCGECLHPSSHYGDCSRSE